MEQKQDQCIKTMFQYIGRNILEEHSHFFLTERINNKMSNDTKEIS